MQAPTQTQDKYSDLNHFYHFTQCVCLCRGELSPQIEEHLLQYVFYLDFYFLIFFFRNDIKKRWLFFCLLWCVPRLCESLVRVIDCTVCLLHIIIYWSYPAIYALLPGHVVLLFDAILLTLFPSVRSVPPGCFSHFLSKHFSHFPLSSATKTQNRRKCVLVQNHRQIFYVFVPMTTAL